MLYVNYKFLALVISDAVDYCVLVLLLLVLYSLGCEVCGCRALGLYFRVLEAPLVYLGKQLIAAIFAILSTWKSMLTLVHPLWVCGKWSPRACSWCHHANNIEELSEQLIGAVRVSHIELSSAIVLNLNTPTEKRPKVRKKLSDEGGSAGDFSVAIHEFQVDSRMIWWCILRKGLQNLDRDNVASVLLLLLRIRRVTWFKAGHKMLSVSIALAVYFMKGCPTVVQQLRMEIAKATKETGYTELSWEEYKKMKFTQYIASCGGQNIFLWKGKWTEANSLLEARNKCSVVLIGKGKAMTLTNDHRLGREDERARTENLGVFLHYHNGVWQVNGSIAVSRAFGNVHLED
ncbi:hypothetical protein BUALT_Bualt08G0100600 [Buddleja alternifolia]|uniref:PPM-type phosphatase domain-containing protein n=1 Tax=Buddleja alternifolia TaxID=168488 RepID=A0AAV6X6D0_9LAMI|nr:hypothetical protein BUALT_Bualt08G0100600 [Buddleja alternifolia]